MPPGGHVPLSTYRLDVDGWQSRKPRNWRPNHGLIRILPFGQRALPSAVKISSAMPHKFTFQIPLNGPPVLIGLHVVGWKWSGLFCENETKLFLIASRQRVATCLAAVFRR